VLDVVVAGDDPVIEVAAVKHWCGSSSLREEPVRVGQVRIMKRIESLGEALRLAWPCSDHLNSLRGIDNFLPTGLATSLYHDVLLLSDLFLNRQVSPSLFFETIGMTLEPAAQSAGSRTAPGHGDGSVN
jgi:hypothetical protein